MAENERWFADLFIEKRPGEIKRSLVLLFTTFAVLTAVGWGLLSKQMITATAILMWGVGDAAAAIVGIPFGGHKVKIKLADGKKSWEGTISMFLTFCIGIRFLVKPDTSREDTVDKGAELDIKGVIISLFFGLTIGFGTGFVGTGGGMMMLVVFTAFLGMELKTAVGTSTFIMTFTALIASITHITIHPAIVLERWDALLICIAVATVCRNGVVFAK